MRLFIGTFLGPSNQRSYDRFIKALVGRHRDALRSIPEGSAHLTYAFCADADDSTADAIAGAARRAAGEHRAFEIRLDAPRVVSAGSRPRLVGAEVLAGATELRRLTADLLTTLELECPNLRLSPTRTPHVTLTRFRKSATRSDARDVSRSLAAAPGAGVIGDQIAHMQIVVSTLTPSGPAYEIRNQVSLAAFDSPAAQAVSMFDLDRFKSAQERTADGFDTAVAELQAGQKRSHWIWYIFPQLAGLGHSGMAVRYGLQGAAEAMDYLRDPVLRRRLLAVTDAVVGQLRRQPAVPLTELMGSAIDALKLVSSVTLFREVARRSSTLEPLPDYAAIAANADAILAVAAEQGLAECQSTLRQLAASATRQA